MDIDKFVAEFNYKFGIPFCEAGHAHAEIRNRRFGTEGVERYVNIRIGKRDVDFDATTGEAIGSGTLLLDAD